MRVAFTLIGGRNWTGGYNYLLNLLRALSAYALDRVQPVVFFGTDVDAADSAPFENIAGVTVVRNAAFNEEFKSSRLRQAILTGCDSVAARIFGSERVDAVFEPAQFYGWRFPMPAVAWIPDFQHRYLKHLFDTRAYWKREFGFRAQVFSGRQIMLSSEDARRDCERFYPATRGRTHVVRFAVPPPHGMDAAAARAVAQSHGLPEHFFFLPNQFWKHKNHVRVIEALRLCGARGKPVVVAVSGKQSDPRDPAHFPALKAMVETSGLAQNFRLLGLIPHAHIPALMRSCDALINPSTFEGWSTTVEEAKAMGTPMVLSSLRVHGEQSGDALFFDSASAEQLADILAGFTPMSPELRQSRSALAAQEAIDSTRRFAQEFADLVERTVGRAA